MKFVTPVLVRLAGVSLLAIFLAGCSSHAYSPALNLPRHQLEKGEIEVGGGLELAPHAEAPASNDPSLQLGGHLRLAVGVTDNVSLTAKAAGYFSNLFVALSAPVRVFTSPANDILVVPRFGATNLGYGGGAALVWRSRPTYGISTFFGPAWYRGYYPNDEYKNEAEENPRGDAYGFHLGLNVRVGQNSSLNLETIPLYQYDDFHEKGVVIPSLSLGFTTRFSTSQSKAIPVSNR